MSIYTSGNTCRISEKYGEETLSFDGSKCKSIREIDHDRPGQLQQLGSLQNQV